MASSKSGTALVDLDALLEETAQTSFDYRGHEVKITFRPERYTVEAMRLHRSEVLEADQEEAANRLLADCIAGWNLSRGGKVLPVTEATVGELSESLKGALAKAMATASRPGEPSASNSE